jgi:hypothetical protein
MFSSPEVLMRLTMDARTRPLLNNAAFKAMLADVQRNPANMTKYMQDPNFQLVGGWVGGTYMRLARAGVR